MSERIYKFHGVTICECSHVENLEAGLRWWAKKHFVGCNAAYWSEAYAMKFKTLKAAKAWARRLNSSGVAGGGFVKCESQPSA